MLYFDTIEERYQYIMKLIANDPSLIPSMDDLSNCCSNFLDINEVMKSVKPAMKYISSGSNGHTFHGFNLDNPENPIHYAIKVVAFPKNKYGEIMDQKRPENAELLMIRLLGKLVLERQTPHLVLPITIFKTSIGHFVEFDDDEDRKKLLEEKRYKRFIDNHKEGIFHDKVSVLISEWADRGDLLNYMRENVENITLNQWKVIMFQLISCLTIIHQRYPTFRHNDMKANNILVQKIKDPNSRQKGFHYRINHNDYFVPSIGIMIKIWDFDFACIPGIVDNAKVSANWTTKVNITPKQNQYYDLHYFLNTIGKKGFVDNFYESIPNEFKDFIHRVIPPEYRNDTKYVTKKGRLLIDTEYTTPLLILENDSFLKEFRKKPKDNLTTNIMTASQAPTLKSKQGAKNEIIIDLKEYSFTTSTSEDE